MAAELVETSRLWGRQNAAIDPVWAERLGAHLVKRTLLRAALVAEARRGDGLRAGHPVRRPAGRRPAGPLRQGRPGAGPRALHPARARVRRVAAPGSRSSQTNRRLLEEAEELEHRARRRDIVVDEETLFDFYDARVPAEGVSRCPLRHLVEAGAARAARTCSPSTPRCWCTRAPTRSPSADFPDVWHEGSLSLPVSYHFEPGHESDGVTIDVPLATLNTVGAAPFTWNVPGLRDELVTALIRSLPKRCGSTSCRRPTWPAVPRRRAAGGGAARWTRCRATCARYRRARAAGGVGLVEGARAPAPDVPRGRRRRRGGRGGKDLDALKRAAAPAVRRCRGAGRGRVGAARAPARPRGRSARSSRRSRRCAPATRCTGFPTLVDEGTRSGCGWWAPPTSRRRSTGSAYAG